MTVFTVIPVYILKDSSIYSDTSDLHWYSVMRSYSSLYSDTLFTMTPVFTATPVMHRLQWYQCMIKCFWWGTVTIDYDSSVYSNASVYGAMVLRVSMILEIANYSVMPVFK